MHETGIVRDLVRQLETVARDAGAASISGVEISIGALSQFSPTHFREHFEEEVTGTMAEGAALDIHESDNPSDPDALHIVIRSIDLEVASSDG